jgi:hypothetical protein
MTRSLVCVSSRGCWLLFFMCCGGFVTQSSALAANDQLPTVEMGSVTLLGRTGLTLNGRIHPHGLPTRYHFEYRRHPQFGHKTVEQQLPPRLAAFYHETWDQDVNGWSSRKKLEHFKEGGASGGFVRYVSPSLDDHNHEEGVGTNHLAKFMYPGSVSQSKARLSAFLAAGDPDFRDARIQLWVRGNDWAPNGSELTWWSQAQSNTKINPDEWTLHPDYRHSNWAYTGNNLTDLLLTGKWERVDYRLIHDSNVWTYGGHNPWEVRYHYWQIDEVQRHLNLNCFHMVVFIDAANPPTGSIDFDEFEVTYRNYSLLFPSNGGKLISAPKSPGEDPATLTDGWRHGEGKMWRSPANPQAPLEFVYRFDNPVTIQSVQIHQHPQCPSKEIEVLVSVDGQEWKELIKKELPKDSSAGPNYAFLLQRNLSAPAQQVKVRILSGYQPEHWGLGEIEMFGSGAVMQTDDDWYHVNRDITDLQPGETYYYRLVATNAAGTTMGQEQSFTMPTDTKPHIVTGAAGRIKATSAKVEGRLNPMGKRTKYHFEYGLDTQYGQQTEPEYGGQRPDEFIVLFTMMTPRTVVATLNGLKPNTLYHYRLVGVNETGTTYGQDGTLKTGASTDQ